MSVLPVFWLCLRVPFSPKRLPTIASSWQAADYSNDVQTSGQLRPLAAQVSANYLIGNRGECLSEESSRLFPSDDRIRYSCETPPPAALEARRSDDCPPMRERGRPLVWSI